MITVGKPKFRPGRLLITPGALEELELANQSPWEFFARHIAGDWGVVNAEDAEANNQALVNGSRLLSAYVLTTNRKLWLITEALDDDGQRSSSLLLKPSEY